MLPSQSALPRDTLSKRNDPVNFGTLFITLAGVWVNERAGEDLVRLITGSLCILSQPSPTVFPSSATPGTCFIIILADFCHPKSIFYYLLFTLLRCPKFSDYRYDCRRHDSCSFKCPSFTTKRVHLLGEVSFLHRALMRSSVKPLIPGLLLNR
ncbi:hypothetical protein BDQ12DRAFT_126006 [Crucibulum laeve]|uniref:Uncharacterized protein n=1 Tax=Crucibulum laeve TaxID=68775 RepID=A0A5C3LYN6_9AGAR|nr:hypothetical protein BDQ12DRAFT_126006 [Crucibulum laeve]